MNMNRNRNQNQNRGFAVITVVLILAILFCVRGTVFSKEQDKRAEMNRYYAVLEKEYLRQTKDILEQEGYDNCGVTVTWVAAEDGSRDYTVQLHHRKLKKLDEQDKNAVVMRLSGAEFDRESCRFSYLIG
jgi:cell division protein FtsI/penicillin-binding protein 2